MAKCNVKTEFRKGKNGSLDGHHATCSCGWTANNSLGLDFLNKDIVDHLNYMEEKANKEKCQRRLEK